MSQKHWQNIYHANVNVHENVEYLTSTIDGSMTNEIIYAIKRCYQKTCYQKMYQKMGQQMLWALYKQIFIKWIVIFCTQFYISQK